MIAIPVWLWINAKKFHPAEHQDGYTLLQVSHIFNILPMLLAYHNHAMVYAVMIFLQTTTSLLYHTFPFNTFYRAADYFFANTLAIYNLINLFLQRNESDFMIKILLLILFITLALYYFAQYKNYPKNHSLWHIFVVCITLVVMY